MKTDTDKFILPNYPADLTRIINSLGIKFSIYSVVFSLKGDTLRIENITRENIDFVKCVLYSWNFKAGTDLSIQTSFNTGKYNNFQYKFESNKSGNSFTLKLSIYDAEGSDIEEIFFSTLHLAYKCFNEAALRSILEIYSDEIFNKNKPLYGAYKIIEILILKYKGINYLAKSNSLSESYIREIKSTAQHQRHVNSSAPRILTEKKCLERTKYLTKNYIDSLSFVINPANFNRLPNEAEKFINLFTSLTISEKYLLFLFCVNNPISREDFYEELDSLRAKVPEIMESNSMQLRILRKLLQNFLDVRPRDEEFILILKQDYIQKVLMYFLHREKNLIKKIIENSIFFNQLSIFSTKKEQGKVRISKKLELLIEKKVLRDFSELYGSDVEKYKDGSYGIAEKNRINKLFKCIELFDLENHPKILQKLEIEIKDVYLNTLFFYDHHFINLIKKVSGFVKLDGISLLQNFFKKMESLDDIIGFIELAEIYKADYQVMLKAKKKEIHRKVHEIVEHELKNLSEQLKNPKDSRNLFGLPTSREVEKMQGQIADVSVFLKINLYNFEDKLEDYWENLFFSELKNKEYSDYSLNKKTLSKNST